MGHRKRRLEGFPALDKKFMRNLLTKFSANHAGRIFETCMSPQIFDLMTVPDFMDLLTHPPVPRVLPPMRTPGLYDAPLSEAGPPKPDEEAGVDDVLREALTLEAPPPDDLAQPS